MAALGCAGGDRLYLFALLRGWRNTVEIVLFEISKSMKPYPPDFMHIPAILEPVMGSFEPQKFDEVSNGIPPIVRLLACMLDCLLD